MRLGSPALNPPALARPRGGRPGRPQGKEEETVAGRTDPQDLHPVPDDAAAHRLACAAGRAAISAGTVMLPSLAAAGRAGAPPLIAYGAGPHFCPGAAFARLGRRRNQGAGGRV